MRVFHVTTAAEWDAGVDSRSYRRSTRGASLDEVGFIHLSDADQLDAVLATGAKLVWEDGGAGEDFPHLYTPRSSTRTSLRDGD